MRFHLHLDPSTVAHLSPYTYLKKTLLDIWHELPVLLGGGILVSLAWFASFILGVFFNQPILSIITLPILMFPTLTGLFRLTNLIGRGLGCGVKDFFHAFRKGYGRSLLLGLFTTLPYALALGTKSVLDGNPKQIWLWGPLITQGSVFIIALLTCVHALSVIPLYNFSIFKIILFSWSLVARAPIATVGMLALFFLLMFLVVWTRFGLFPIVIGCWAMFASNLTWMTLREANFDQTFPS